MSLKIQSADTSSLYGDDEHSILLLVNFVVPRPGAVDWEEDFPGVEPGRMVAVTQVVPDLAIKQPEFGIVGVTIATGEHSFQLLIDPSTYPTYPQFFIAGTKAPIIWNNLVAGKEVEYRLVLANSKEWATTITGDLIAPISKMFDACISEIWP